MNGATWNKLIELREAQDELDDACYWLDEANAAVISAQNAADKCKSRQMTAWDRVVNLAAEIV